MWGYHNSEAMGTAETYLFETKEDACKFVSMATQRNMEKYPDIPDLWPMIDGDCGIIFEISVKTPEEAFSDWFGEDV